MNELSIRFAMFAIKIDGIKYDARKKLEALQAELAEPTDIEVRHQKEAERRSITNEDALRHAAFNSHQQLAQQQFNASARFRQAGALQGQAFGSVWNDISNLGKLEL